MMKRTVIKMNRVDQVMKVMIMLIELNQLSMKKTTKLNGKDFSAN